MALKNERAAGTSDGQIIGRARRRAELNNYETQDHRLEEGVRDRRVR
jgi:hypothetical protein